MSWHTAQVRCQECSYEIHPPLGVWSLCPECGKVVVPHRPVDRARAGLISAALIVAFAAVLICTGASKTPVALLMLPIGGGTALFPLLLGWGGVGLSVVASRTRTPLWHVSLTMLGLLSLAGSLACLTVASDDVAFTFATELPFVAIALLRCAGLTSFARAQRHEARHD